MSHWLYFEILPHNPLVTPNSPIRLPIDAKDVGLELQQMYPDGELSISQDGDDTTVMLYLSFEDFGPLVVAEYTDKFSYFCVSGWPKRIAKRIVLWYRNFIASEFQLFLIISDKGYVVELFPGLTEDDVEQMYPYQVPEE